MSERVNGDHEFVLDKEDAEEVDDTDARRCSEAWIVVYNERQTCERCA